VGEAILYAVGLGGIVACPECFCCRLCSGPPQSADVQALGAGTGHVLMACHHLRILRVDAAFRSSGDTRTPMLILGSSVAMTLVLDPVLILGHFGIPAMGIPGGGGDDLHARRRVPARDALLFRRG